MACEFWHPTVTKRSELRHKKDFRILGFFPFLPTQLLQTSPWVTHLSGVGVRTGLENVTSADNSVKTGAMFMVFLTGKILMPCICRCCVGCKTGVPFGVASSPIPWPVPIFGKQEWISLGLAMQWWQVGIPSPLAPLKHAVCGKQWGKTPRNWFFSRFSLWNPFSQSSSLSGKTSKLHDWTCNSSAFLYCYHVNMQLNRCLIGGNWQKKMEERGGTQ